VLRWSCAPCSLCCSCSSCGHVLATRLGAPLGAGSPDWRGSCNKPPVCTSDADCGGVQTKTCDVMECGLGACVLNEVAGTLGVPCPSDSCGSDADCASQSKKTCHYKKCSGGTCMPVDVERDKNDPCPEDQCSDDSECGGLSGPPIIDDF
jgi:hypothetical protein